MKVRIEMAFLLIIGFFQCLTYELIPAAGVLLTGNREASYSLKLYGTLFIAPAIAGFMISWWGGKLARRKGVFPLFLIGVCANFLVIFCIGGTLFALPAPAIGFTFLIVAILFSGMGYGAIYPLAIIRAYQLFKGNALGFIMGFLGVTALGLMAAPLVLKAAFDFGLFTPLLMSFGLIWIIIFIVIDFFTWLPISKPFRKHSNGSSKRQFLFLLTQFLVVGIETTFATALPFYISQFETASTFSNLRLVVFWSCVGIGRFVFTYFKAIFVCKWMYRIFPLFSIALLIMLSQAKTGSIALIAAFGFIESIQFPLTLYLAQVIFKDRVPTISGKILAWGWIGGGLFSFLAIHYQSALSSKSYFSIIAILVTGVWICNFFIIRNLKNARSGYAQS